MLQPGITTQNRPVCVDTVVPLFFAKWTMTPHTVPSICWVVLLDAPLHFLHISPDAYVTAIRYSLVQL